MPTQTVIGNPPINHPVDQFDSASGAAMMPSRPWVSWFNAAFKILFADAQSGTTANRPTDLLWPGRPYFDISLGANGKKIFVNKNANGWVDSSGNSV